MARSISWRSTAPATLLLACTLPAQGTPFLVTDLNTSPATSFAFGSIRAGELAGSFSIFLADDGMETSVWRTNGTGAGTVLLTRIAAAHAFNDPVEVVTGNGLVYFVGPDLGSGKELWVSDGTAAGTLPIGNGGRSPMSLAVDAATGRVWFSATDATNGRELWRSDGTLASTVRVTQLRPGSANGLPAATKRIAPLPSGVFFAGESNTSGMEVWRLSGITQSLFANIAASSASSNPREFCWSGDYLIFAADGPNGTEPYCIALGALQTIDVLPGSSSSQPTDFIAYQPALTQPQFWFGADTATQGRELVRYNPFSQTTTIVDVLPGGSSNPHPRFQLGTRIVFEVTGIFGGSITYAIGGTGTTPTQIFTSYPSAGAALGMGPVATSPARMVVRIEDPIATFTLHRSDGTVAGTVPIEANAPFAFVVTALPGGTSSLLSDGRVVSTTGAPVPLVPAGVTNAAAPTRLAAMGGGVTLFESMGRAWRSDGTAAGTQPLLTFLSSSVTGGFSPLFQGRRFFLTTLFHFGLYATDGTPAGTQLISSALPPASTVSWAVRGSQLFVFLGNNLYVTDGIAAPQLLHSGLPAAPAPATLGNFVLFRGQNGANGVELWRTDGTAVGTQLVRDVWPGSASGLGTGNETQWSLRPLGNQLLFAADDGAGDELWRTDGTQAGTAIVTSIAGGPASALISMQATTAGGRVLFAATSPVTGRDLWSTDGTFAGTQLLADDSIGNAATVLGFAGGQWLFTVGDATTARLYGTGGTAASTTLVANLNAGGSVARGTAVAGYGGSSDGIALFGLGSALHRSDATGIGTFAIGQSPTLSDANAWFTLPGADISLFGGRTSGFGREPWRSNGFAGGTTRLADLNPGNASSEPMEFTQSGGLIFFTADDGTCGRELWAMPSFPAVFAYGSGCPGTGGLVPRIVATAPARLGTALEPALRDGLPNAIAIQTLGLAGLDVPIGGGCSVLTDAVVLNAVITDPAGTAMLPVPIPNSLAFVGVSLYAQYAVLDPNGAFGAFLSLSAGLQALVGI